MSNEGDYITLPSGYRFYACFGIIGIGDKLEPTHGYDGGLPLPPWDERANDDIEEAFTKQDAIELADLMIARWTAFRRKCEDVE